ncbi:MAG: EamA family transporter [Comamonadaceae bacterium CG1_02_60_18]|nr:MAG: EamA family transporter [Comamonadaceae bacterium CG1_02_60_18]PIQ51698.1 MAG: EamA family transporter [Comamonadaceae bacterium CG12_big_fil_rev_8_21_14_0_65_59_15]
MQALWMVLASFLFATMAVGIKVASTSFNLFELVFYRGVVSMVFMALALRSRGVALRTPVPWMHAWRTVVGVTAMAAWFYAIAHLSLPTAMTLNYMSGVWVAAFVVGGALLYGKATPQGSLLATVLAGFAGVVIMLRPSLDQSQLFAGLVGLLSGLAASLAYLQVTALGKVGEPEGRTVFYFAVGTAFIGLAGASWVGWTPWASVRWQAGAWLVPLGVLASLGQWSMTRAFSRGATLLVANLQYSGIVFGAFYGLWLLDDTLDPREWLGMTIIVVSGIAATALRNRVLPDNAAEEH